MRNVLTRSIAVDQISNPFVHDGPGGKTKNRYAYKVTKTVNTLDVAVGSTIPAPHIEDMIDDGVRVTVTHQHGRR